MIPVRLRVRNFLSYRDNVPPLLLEGVHVVCLCGENGAGKSALLDAITWALWGETRRGSSDDLIHLGRDEMEVELEFLVRGELYRVVRKRDRGAGRRSGRTLLELQLSDGDGFRPITGNSVRETQRSINQRLHMDFQTFVNSAYLVQGRADEFTLKSPDRRKQVLADILDLGYYDSLAERAREEAGGRREERRALDMAIEETERELARREEYEASFSETEARLGEQEVRREAAEAEAQRLRLARQSLEQQRAQHLELQGRLSQVGEELERRRQRAEALRKEISEYGEVVADAETVERGYAQLQEAMAHKEQMEARSRHYLALSQQRALSEQAIDGARAKLVTEREVLAAPVRELEARAGRLEDASAQLAQGEQALNALDELQGRVAEQRAAVQELVATHAGLEAANQQRRREMDDIKDKMEQLREGRGVCPLCGTELGEDRCEGALALYQAQGKEKGDAHRREQAEMARLQEEETLLTDEVGRLESRLRLEQPALQARAGTLRNAIEEATRAGAELPSAQASLSEVERRLGERLYVVEEQAALEEVLAQLEGLGYDSEAHSALQADVERLRSVEGRYRLLEEAQRRLPRERQLLEEAEGEMERGERDAAAQRLQLEALGCEVEALPDIGAQLEEQEGACRAMAGEVDRLRQALGAAQRDLARLDELGRGRAERQAAMARAAGEQSIFDELAIAFGRRGLQALIIESAVPEIEDEANRLLARMTDNRMHLKLETQGGYRTREGVQETLEIEVFDQGTRRYETFSGGEAFRINLALRIALSRLLARRAGAPLPILFIDEGFGTQDVAGRDKVVEAIQAIKDDFELIIVITHMDELKEQFPIRIEVQKTPEGSIFWMA